MSDLSNDVSDHNRLENIMSAMGERLKFIYSGTLKELSIDDASFFWNQVYHNFFEKEFTIQHFFEALWNATLEPPFYIVFSILNSLDFYLTRKKKSLTNFVHVTLRSLSNGLIVSSERVLLLTNPYLFEFFDSKDLHVTILKAYCKLARAAEIQRETNHQIISHRIEGDCGIALMIYRFVVQPPQEFKSGRFPSYDFENWTGSIMQSIVVSFNLPPFDELRMLSDYNTITDLISPSRIQFHNEQVLLDNKPFAVEVSLHDHLRNFNCDIEKADVPDCIVFLALNDYVCPVRDRIVIHKGCVYGAPVFMYELKYRRFERPTNFLSTVISALQKQKSELWLSLQDKHTQVLSKSLLKLDVLYNIGDESISINNVHFISGVPAKILKKVLSTYTETKRTEYQYREFTKDSFIVNDPLNPNFVVRLSRLTKALESTYPELKLFKIAPGRLKLVISCVLNYSEF